MRRGLGRRANQIANEAMIFVGGRYLGIINVVEFPKCGGTWLPMMLATYRGVPDVRSNDQLLGRGGVYKRHALYSGRYNYPVVLVRDTRDAYASFYHHDLRRNRLPNGFVHEPGAPLMQDFGAYLDAKLSSRGSPGFRHDYGAFAESWCQRSSTPHIRYEGLLAQPLGGLHTVEAYSGDAWDSGRVQAATDRRSLKGGSVAERGPEHGSARRGVSGDWVRHFDSRSPALLAERVSRFSCHLGYPLP